MRLILQPSQSIEMSAVKVKFAVMEKMPLWMLSTCKERAGSGFVLSVHLVLVHHLSLTDIHHQIKALC